MLLRGHGTLDQGDRQAEVPAGAFTVYNVGRPYRIGIGTADGAGPPGR
jgi:hypothetical protein